MASGQTLIDQMLPVGLFNYWIGQLVPAADFSGPGWRSVTEAAAVVGES